MKAEILSRFGDNLARVESLVAAYEAALSARGGGSRVSGRVAVTTTDLLRAAVVFLHATIEDLLRSALDWRLPLAAPEHLANVPLVDCKKGGQEPYCDLSDLARHRGKTVDLILQESVTAHLADSNFNHPGQIVNVLVALGLATSILDPYKNTLGPMMARRHWIVHRADRNEMPGQGQHVAKSLSLTTVNRWRDAVRDFGADFTAALP
jgi:hypothetical protein